MQPRSESARIAQEHRGAWAALFDRFLLEAHVDARWRNFGLVAPEVGGGLHWRFLFVQAGYQLRGEWLLEGRPLEVKAVTLAAGWVARWWQSRRFAARTLLGVVLERLSVERTDLPSSTSRAYWEAGARLGALFSIRLGGGVETGISLCLTWFPAARPIQIPDGPSGKYNDVSLQTGIVLLFGPGTRGSR